MEGLEIYTVELYRKVRLACADGMSKRAAARHFNISRDTVDKAMAFSVPPGYRRTAPIKRPKLDGFTEIIDAWLDGDREVRPKQRHTAKRVYDRLREEHGFTGGYTIIKDYIRERERRGREVFVPLAHPPGDAQADFGEATVIIGGVEQKAYFFVMDLPHSDACFVRAYPAATAEAWMDGHVHAFAFFGGVPQSILYDNDRCLVSKILADGTRKRATLFSALQSHYLVRDRYGRPGKGNDKGKVEGIVGYARRNFMVPIPRSPSWEAVNADLEAQCRTRQNDVLRGHKETIGERLQRDLAAMKPLPGAPFEACAQASGQVSSQSLVRYESSSVTKTIRGIVFSEERLLGPCRLWPSGRLGSRLCRSGRDRLSGRRDRPASAVLRQRRCGLRPDPLPSLDRTQDQCPGSGCAFCGVETARRVPDPAAPHGGTDGEDGTA